MKKTLKLVGIFIAILVVGIGGGLSVYFLIQNNKTFYIYDLRFVEPHAEASVYVYVVPENEYTTFKNQTVYMTADADNKLEVAVFAHTSNNTRDVKITSSDTSVAEIVYEDGKCYVKYKTAGSVVISASIDDVVSDSFVLNVYNKSAENFVVYDRSYYGEYANMFENKVIAYADGVSYKYDFLTNSIFSTEDNQDVNSSMIRIDPASINKDVFEEIKIDASTQELIIKCKPSVNQMLVDQHKTTLDESIAVQSYYYSKEGEIKFLNTYAVNIHVIADTPQFIQMEMATNPDFENSYIFMDNSLKDFSNDTEEEILADIENFLLYQKVESYIAENNEKSTYTGFFTDKISQIYVRFRTVYANGDIVYLDPSALDDDEDLHGYTIDFSTYNYFTASQNKKYFILNLDESDFAGDPINVNVKLKNFDTFDATFVFEYKEYTAENVEDFYAYFKKTNTFVYKYWDPRTRYSNEICDRYGNVINFGGIEVDFDSLTPMDPPEVELPEGEGESA